MKKGKYKKIFFSIAVIAMFGFLNTQYSLAASSADTSAVGEDPKFENPLQEVTVDALLSKVLTTIQGIVAVLAVLMIVIGGIMYMTSGGDSSRVETAKKAVTAALIGLALTVAAPSLLREIYSVLGATAPGNAPAGKSLTAIILDTLNLLLSVLGTLAIIMLVVGGIMYMVSGGDNTRAETAKNTIKFAIIGLIVALVSLVVVTQISNVLT